MSSEKSLLVMCQLLGLFPTILAGDDKYPVLKREKLTIAIKMQFFTKIFSQFFSAFFKSALNLEHFKQKDDPLTFCISQTLDSGNVIK